MPRRTVSRWRRRICSSAVLIHKADASRELPRNTFAWEDHASIDGGPAAERRSSVAGLDVREDDVGEPSLGERPRYREAADERASGKAGEALVIAAEEARDAR